MNIGIYYETKLKSVNSQLQSIGSALMIRGTANYYFTNPIVAMRAKQYLNKKMPNFKYELINLQKTDVSSKTLFKTYDDFLEFCNPINKPSSLDCSNGLDKEELND